MIQITMSGKTYEKGILAALEYLSEKGIKCSIAQEAIHVCVKDLDRMIDKPDSVNLPPQSSVEDLIRELKRQKNHPLADKEMFASPRPVMQESEFKSNLQRLMKAKDSLRRSE